jgi:hypothetical protein
MKLKDLLQGYTIQDVAFLYFDKDRNKRDAGKRLNELFSKDKLNKKKLLEVLTVINLNTSQRVSQYFNDLDI